MSKTYVFDVDEAREEANIFATEQECNPLSRTYRHYMAGRRAQHKKHMDIVMAEQQHWRQEKGVPIVYIPFEQVFAFADATEPTKYPSKFESFVPKNYSNFLEEEIQILQEKIKQLENEKLQGTSV